jgi:uncharacterized membrane protein YdjX (TVP38/TMEM64 family)
MIKDLRFKIFLLLLLLLSGVGLAYFYGQNYLTLDYLRETRTQLMAQFQKSPWKVSGGFFLIYVVVAALSIPGASVLTLAAGAIFGFWWGLALVSLASTLGATLAFSLTRFIFRDFFQTRFKESLKEMNHGIKHQGGFYLFMLRASPAFPFFLVNGLMGLTPISIGTFWWVSQAGMLPGTALYIQAGTQLSQVHSPRDILTPSIFLLFTLLGGFPLLMRKVFKQKKTPKN